MDSQTEPQQGELVRGASTATLIPQTLPPWAGELLRIGVAVLLAFLAARYGISVPPPAPGTLATTAAPSPVTVQFLMAPGTPMPSIQSK